MSQGKRPVPPKPKRRDDTMRCSLRRAALLFGVLTLLALIGCATGFSGGSIPIGFTRVAGKVVRAESPLTPIANATVQLTVTVPGTTTRVFQAVTDANGRFEFTEVPADDKGNTNAQMTIQPGVITIRSQQIGFILRQDVPATLIAALPPASFDVARARRLEVLPSSLLVGPQVTAQLSAQMLDADGNVLPLVPTLLLYGDIGTITGDGTFHSTAGGSGTAVALWYNNLQSELTTVTVDPALPSEPLPPPPPALPPPNDKQLNDETKT